MFGPEERLFFTSSEWQKSLEFTKPKSSYTAVLISVKKLLQRLVTTCWRFRRDLKTDLLSKTTPGQCVILFTFFVSCVGLTTIASLKTFYYYSTSRKSFCLILTYFNSVLVMSKCFGFVSLRHFLKNICSSGSNILGFPMRMGFF